MKVFQVLVAVAAALSLISGVIFIAGADRFNPLLAQEYANGDLSIEEDLQAGGLLALGMDFSRYYEKGNFAFPIFVMTMMGAAAAIVALVVIIILKNIFKTLLEEEKPFSENIFKKLKLGFIIITAAFVLFVGLGSGVIIGLLLWCIYSILEYGAALQTEIDETI